MRIASADPYPTRPLISPQADLNRIAARQAAAARAFRIISNAAAAALLVVTVVGVGLILGMTGLKHSLNIDATLAQAEALRGM